MVPSIQKGFADIPRIDLTGGPTPLYRATGLESALNREGVEAGIYLKRDDLIPIGGGGNKARKLQYHMASVIAAGHDTVITFGGLQSNHARLTAAVCARLGLECHLILTQEVDINTADYNHNGNVLLNRIFGAQSHVLARGASAQEHATLLSERLSTLGKSVAVIPVGGSTPLGALGYADCAIEISQQAEAGGMNLKSITVANGSSGTQAGLIAGWCAIDRDPRTIKGFAVMTSAADAVETTTHLAASTLELAGFKHGLADAVHVDDSQLGAAYGQPTHAMLEAVTLLARTEGLLLDPVYSGKAFAGLLSQLRQGAYQQGDDVVFVMTGGVPGLYAYQASLADAWAGSTDTEFCASG
jgi:D-cysteine desulfhydrase